MACADVETLSAVVLATIPLLAPVRQGTLSLGIPHAAEWWQAIPLLAGLSRARFCAGVLSHDHSGASALAAALRGRAGAGARPRDVRRGASTGGPSWTPPRPSPSVPNAPYEPHEPSQVHSPVPYLVGVPALSNVPEFGEGFLNHVHTLHGPRPPGAATRL